MKSLEPHSLLLLNVCASLYKDERLCIVAAQSIFLLNHAPQSLSSSVLVHGAHGDLPVLENGADFFLFFFFRSAVSFPGTGASAKKPSSCCDDEETLAVLILQNLLERGHVLSAGILSTVWFPTM